MTDPDDCHRCNNTRTIVGGTGTWFHGRRWIPCPDCPPGTPVTRPPARLEPPADVHYQWTTADGGTAELTIWHVGNESVWVDGVRVYVGDRHRSADWFRTFRSVIRLRFRRGEPLGLIRFGDTGPFTPIEDLATTPGWRVAEPVDVPPVTD